MRVLPGFFVFFRKRVGNILITENTTLKAVCRSLLQTNREAINMSASFRKEQLERQAWLLYFNQVLLDRGLITEEEYRRMLLQIKAHA